MTQHLLPTEAPITEDDAFLAEVLQHASIPTLMMSMLHMSGDTSILRGTVRPKPPQMGEVQGYLSEDEKAQVRAQALAVIRRYRDSGCRLPPPPSPETVREMMNFIIGTQLDEGFLPLMLEELALDGHDARAPRWQKPVPDAAKRAFHVVVIGAGMSGLLAAMRLKEIGVAFTVIEKNDAVGGTWFENRYPGCRVDVCNHFYSYSFDPNHDWSEYFSRRDELFAYFDGFADKHGLRPHIHFRTEVVSAVFDEARALWSVTIRRADGTQETLQANAVISAVGQLNRPMIPQVRGAEKFRGAAFHTAQWQPQHALRGKRIAVIGSGASAFQVVPELAKIAGQLYVFQRSATWMFPNPDYHAPVNDAKKWLLKHLPYYARWYRFLVFWPGSGAAIERWTIDPAWPHQQRSVNALNEQEREYYIAWLRQQIGDDETLLRKVTPDYPPGGKRMLQDNGTWLRALKQPNVELVTEALEALDETGIVGRDRHYDVDVIVYATGFHANKVL
ncbi:MAG: flavin-containing monooxygenase, partial [Gammaproteobacteria bacterium]